MAAGGGHLRAVRLLPFAAAALDMGSGYATGTVMVIVPEAASAKMSVVTTTVTACANEHRVPIPPKRRSALIELSRHAAYVPLR